MEPVLLFVCVQGLQATLQLKANKTKKGNRGGPHCSVTKHCMNQPFVNMNA